MGGASFLIGSLVSYNASWANGNLLPAVSRHRPRGGGPRPAGPRSNHAKAISTPINSFPSLQASLLLRAPFPPGFAVVAPDLQGHGLSDCFEGLRGYVRAFEDWVADTELVGYRRAAK